jgi:hypothetical protein
MKARLTNKLVALDRVDVEGQGLRTTASDRHGDPAVWVQVDAGLASAIVGRQLSWL